jgi:type I restriction-modification system DNA methylase subunit
LPATLDTFTGAIQSLIKKFDSDRHYYLSKAYSEAEARVDLITPFFRGLGWDVENEAGLPHHAREVLVEKTEQEGHGKPDYSFRIGGQTKFFVEAKAPHEALSDPKHILQAKRYAWNTKQVFFVVLTDFEEFRFYDASIKPDERKPDEGLLFPPLKYADYLKHTEKLWEFSRERVAAGSLDAMLPRDRRTERLRIPVDEAFLDEMTGWREELARDIYKNNQGMTARQLNEVVQRLLDRIVFIRIAEDRRIIERFQLRDAAEQWRARGGKFDIFDWLRPLFQKINDDFNGEIFKPNELLEKTRVDSEVLAKTIERLYPPKSPYRFDVIGVELLGSIYERYLGKTIRPTAKTVRVEEKPEVRKAGGVYYTPKYIVDYIVKNTVGKIIEGKSPKQIEKIRILDPACGSGSFLIGAFQCLIDYHVRYFAEHPKEARVHPLYPYLVRDDTGEPRLSVGYKTGILRRNLSGVDIDPQAVEITMMSLYLKALEGEKSLLPAKQSLLPELKYNIICGNSLIGPDIYDQGTLFGDEERERINAFDWNSDALGFGSIMKEGGFDCVIGNPPYVRSQELGEEQRRYYHGRYSTATATYDIYVLFVERALSALKREGRLGFILPNKFFTTDYGAGLRQLLTAPNAIERIVDFEDGQVFPQAGNYTCLLFLRRDGPKYAEYARLGAVYRERGAEGLVRALRVGDVEFERLKVEAGPARWTLAAGRFGQILARLQRKLPTLALLEPHIFQGLKTSADKIFLVKVSGTKGKLSEVETANGERFYVESAMLRPVVKGEHVQRYWIDLSAGLHILYPYKVAENGRAVLVESETLERQFPRAWEYLEENKKSLGARDRGVWAKRPDWYAYARSQNIGTFVGTKLLIPYMTTRVRVAPDTEGSLFFVNITTGGYGARFNYGCHHAHYVTGLLNSCLLDKAAQQMTNAFRGGYFAVNKQAVERLPFRPINFSDPADKARHDKMVALVERMLELNKKRHSGKLAPSELDHVEREIAATDAEIDNLVYELYGITDKERKIVEGKDS